MIVVGYYGFTLVIHVSFRPSSFSLNFHLRMITRVNIKGFSANLLLALILQRPALGLPMSKFCQFLIEFSACDMSIFSGQ